MCLCKCMLIFYLREEVAGVGVKAENFCMIETGQTDHSEGRSAPAAEPVDTGKRQMHGINNKHQKRKTINFPCKSRCPFLWPKQTVETFVRPAGFSRTAKVLFNSCFKKHSVVKIDVL